MATESRKNQEAAERAERYLKDCAAAFGWSGRPGSVVQRTAVYAGRHGGWIAGHRGSGRRTTVAVSTFTDRKR